MNIDLNEEQYENLLQAALIGNFIINALKDDEEYSPEYEELIESLLLKSKEQGLDHLYQETDEELIPSDKMLKGMDGHIENFFQNTMEQVMSMEEGDINFEEQMDFEDEEFEIDLKK